jgi:hypothetical protein
MDLQGPYRASVSTGYGIRGINDVANNSSSSHHTFSHMKIHGWSSGVFCQYTSHHTFEYLDVYDISSLGGPSHPNIFFIHASNYGIIRYSKFHDTYASGTGINFSDLNTGPANYWQVYGNLFYDMPGVTNTALSMGGEGAVVLGMKIYNNVYTDIGMANIRLSGATCGTGCETKNNIFKGPGSTTTCGATSNNLTTNNSSIFVNSAIKDFHIVSTTGSGYPRGVGTNLSSYFSTDMDKKPFGSDGTWDIGAYAYNTDGGGGSIAKPSAPMNFYVN